MLEHSQSLPSRRIVIAALVIAGTYGAAESADLEDTASRYDVRTASSKRVKCFGKVLPDLEKLSHSGRNVIEIDNDNALSQRARDLGTADASHVSYV